jgi:hypothetical protein
MDAEGWGFIDAATNAPWLEALQPQPRDPLAIDLDGDGIETIGVPTTGSPVLFDHNADGVRTGTGWVRPDDAWLVRDLNGNGTIDSGRELFGVDTLITVTEPDPLGASARVVTRHATTGFEALRTLDTGNGTAGSAGHNDGFINASDAAFATLRIWRDLNQDGISQPAELQSLPEAGIAAISLTVYAASINLGNGNTVTGTATVTRSDGTTTLAETVSMQAGNLDLADNPFFREFTTAIPPTAAALALPEMGGRGLLRDLREAMSLGTPYAAKLVTAVQAFSAATTRTQQRALLDDVLATWAETAPETDQIQSKTAPPAKPSDPAWRTGHMVPRSRKQHGPSKP